VLALSLFNILISGALSNMPLTISEFSSTNGQTILIIAPFLTEASIKEAPVDAALSKLSNPSILFRLLQN
jgi:hypothetical protein